MLRLGRGVRRGRPLFAIVMLASVVAACAGHGTGTLPPDRSAQELPMPKSQSPAGVKPAPMAKTALLPSSAMKSPLARKADTPGASWTLSPGSASQVSAAPDGSLWALSTDPAGSTDKYIWHYANGAWTNISGMANHIAVAPDGTLYAINAGGGTYSYSTSTGAWTALGGGAIDVTVAADGSTYVLSNAGSSADKAIWHNVHGTWTQVPGSGTFLAASWNTASHTTPQGTLAGDGLYILNSQGAIYYLNPDNTYVQFSGAASAVSPVSGGLYALSYPANTTSGNPLYYYDFTTNSWSSVNGSGVSISANASALYVVGASGAIYASPITQTIASISLAAGGPAVPVGMPASVPLTLTVKDAGGNTITGTYPQAITLSDSDTSGATSLSATSITSSSQAASLTLHYNGANVAPATITASVSGVTPATASFSPNTDSLTSNGTSYTYAINGSKYWTRPSQTASPVPTPLALAVTQTVSTGTFGQSNLIDVHTFETYSQPANQAGRTTTFDAYDQWIPTSSGAQLVETGSTTNVSNGWNTRTTFTPGALLDEIPHAAGLSWTPNDASTATDTQANGNTVICTGPSPLPADYNDSIATNADGSYVTTYHSASIDGTCTTNDHYVVNGDGSGTETFSSTGSSDFVAVIGTPEPGASGYVIPITESGGYSIVTPSPGATAPPTPAPTTTTVPDWYPGGAQAPAPMLSDKFVDQGTASIPASCNVPATLAITGEKIVETYTDFDPFGGVYNDLFTSYETTGVGTVCVIANFSQAVYTTESLTNVYYGTFTETYTEGLTAATLQTDLRRTHSASAALAQAEHSFNTRVAQDVRAEMLKMREMLVVKRVQALRARLHR